MVDDGKIFIYTLGATAAREIQTHGDFVKIFWYETSDGEQDLMGLSKNGNTEIIMLKDQSQGSKKDHFKAKKTLRGLIFDKLSVKIKLSIPDESCKRRLEFENPYEFVFELDRQSLAKFSFTVKNNVRRTKIGRSLSDQKNIRLRQSKVGFLMG